MEHNQSRSARQNPRRRLQPAWCRCGADRHDAVYMPDLACPCGVKKHHYHCPDCLGIAQVG